MEVTFEQAHAYWEKRSGEYKLPAKDKISLSCPFHGNDRNPSLEVNLAKGGVWRCFACGRQGGLFHFEKEMFGGIEGGLSDAQIWQRIHDLTGIPLESGSGSGPAHRHGPVVATYRYTDADGKLIFEKDKRAPLQEGMRKTFVFRVPNDRGKWDYTLSGVKARPLYRMPDIRNASVIFVVEGEKDTDRLREAMGGTSDAAPTIIDRRGKPHPLAVTTNFDGAGNWLAEYNYHFSSRHVAIFPDNDEPGEAHALAIAEAILPYAQTVKIVRLPGLPHKGDVSDFLDAHPVEDLLAELIRAPRFQREVRAEVVSDKPFFVTADQMFPEGVPQISWYIPRVVHRISRGMIVAAPKAGKSMLGLDMAIALASGQQWLGIEPARQVRVGVLSREDSPVLTINRVQELARARGHHLGSLPNLLLNTFAQRHSFFVDKDDHLKELCKAITSEGISVLMCDVLNKLHAGDENSNTEMTKVMQRFDQIQAETGVDVVVIHHDVKNAAAGLKKPRGASALNSWWDWSMSIDVDPSDPLSKEVFFATKAAMPHPAMQVKIMTHPALGTRIIATDSQGDAQEQRSITPYRPTGSGY